MKLHQLFLTKNACYKAGKSMVPEALDWIEPQADKGGLS